MAAVATPVVPHPRSRRATRKGTVLLGLLRTTDHKQIGILYLTTSFGFFMVGGAMALLMRTELARPGLQFLSSEQYNQLFTVHGTVMMLFYATPNVFGFANFVLPLQIGSPDVAFPRLNAMSYWLYLFGGLMVLGGFAAPGGAADFGWFAYAPLNNELHSPGIGGDLWAAGLIVSGLGTILGAVNMVTTVICLRGPGMTMFRMPIFTWNILFTSVLVLMAFPILTAALFAMLADRHLGAHVFDPANGGAILWQHLFWFFGHPEVYIVALPYFGIVSEIIPVFSRKPLFGYKAMVFATLAIAFLSMTVWAHHMFATGAVLLPFFSFMTFLIAVPTGVKFFNWILTMWRGQLTFESPMLWSIGFLVTFLFGGLTGILLAAPAIDFHVTDTYFVVGHFHYVLFGTIVFATFAGIYFWFPKITGRYLDEPLRSCTSGPRSSGFTPPSWSTTGSATKACPAGTPTTCPATGSPRSTPSPPSAHICWASPYCRSSGTCSRATATANSPTPTPPGATATPWNGPPPAHHLGTTSSNYPESAPNAPRSNCTTHTWSPELATRHTPAYPNGTAGQQRRPEIGATKTP
jgi:cytochrome c oxidase subunit I